MPREWTFYVEDIRDSARKILRYTDEMEFSGFEQDELVFDAVVRNLEIIGEAAKHLPDEARALMPEIDWVKAAAFRNVLAHQYFGLDIRIIWDVVQTKIPDIYRVSSRVLNVQS